MNASTPSAELAPTLTWEKGETRDEWTLLVNGEPVADLSRSYPQRWGGVGKGRVAARDLAMFWTLAPWGGARDSTKPCPDGSTAAVAKAAAEATVRGWK